MFHTMGFYITEAKYIQSSFPLEKRIVMSSKLEHGMGLSGYCSCVYIIKNSLTKAGLRREFS